MVMKPITRSLENESGAFLVDILNPLKAKTKYKQMIKVVPKKPNSSPITAKIESPCGSGKYLNFCKLCPKPFPQNQLHIRIA